jgi:hypothetical protein
MGSLINSGLLSSVAQAVPSSTTQPMPIDPMEAMYGLIRLDLIHFQNMDLIHIWITIQLELQVLL